MINKPTYTAIELKEMCTDFIFDYGTFRIIIDLIEEELDLYDQDDLIIIMQASMIIFSRALISNLWRIKNN